MSLICSWMIYIQGGTPQKLELSLRGWAPLQYRLPLLCECSRNPSVSVYQLALLREAAFGFSEFLLKTLSVHLPISWCVIQKHTWPHCNECSAVFDQKRHGPHSPPSLFTGCHPQQLIFVSLDEKSLQREMFCHVEEVRQKMAEALKGIKTDKFKNCFEQWKKIGILCQMESTLRVTSLNR